LFFLGIGAAAAGRNEEVPADAIAVPRKTWYEGCDWTYDPAFQDGATYLEADLDGDPEDEVVIGYVATYKPPRERTQGPRMFEIPQKQIPVIERRVFYKIYDRDAGGHWQCVHTSTGLEEPGKVLAYQLDPGEPTGLLIISTAGKTYLDIRLHQWREGGYRLLASTGISEPYAFSTRNPAMILLPGTESVLFWSRKENKFVRHRVPPASWKFLWQYREVDV